MGRHRLSSPEMAVGGAIPDPFPLHIQWPFGRLDALTRDEVRSSAYEIFFTAFRFTSAGGRLAVAGDNHEGQGTKASSGAKNMVVTSRLKRSLGLRARRMRSMVGARPMTSAEIMRRQMGVSEQTDGLVRKTLARCLVGPQMPKKVESLVLPMELLRRLKASEFADAGEYRSWQLRQLKLLEAGLVLHPFVPLDKSPAASSVSEMIRSTEPQIDVRALSATVMALAWRCSVEVCHWADGYPLNVHLYLSLLRAVFDLRDETVVLDEVDELLELIKKTWSMLGLNRMIHNVCFTWVLFERYVTTGQVEPDLLSATLVMLQHVSEDARKAEREPGYGRVLSATLASVYYWAENKLLDYHEAFDKSSMKNVVTLAVLAAELLGQHAPAAASAGSPFSAADLIERYIKSSVRRAFAKLDESGNAGGSSMLVEVEEDPGEALMYVAAQTKEIARVEKDLYSPILRQWHPCPAAIAAVTLHSCFGIYLKRYVSKMASCLSSESMRVLQMASELDKYLVQVAHDDDDDEDGSVSKQMIPYDVDSIIVGLVTEWMDDRLRIGAECVRRARDSETWNPSSKNEPFAQSAVDLMKLAKATVDELMEIHQQRPMPELVQHLVDGIDRLVQRYALFVASSCGGSKESYIPPLPPLTRCNQDSRLLHQLLLNLNCGVGTEATVVTATRVQQRVVRPTTSSATQRLYVRLNTLHYLLGVLRSIDRSVAPRGQRHVVGHRRARSSSFDHAYPAVDAAIAHVTELSAYRLVFLDSAPYFHQALYQGGVAGARIRPVLRVMKQNLAFLGNVVGERAQPLAVREVMKASVEAFLVVLLAGGSGRAFSREDHRAVAEDFTGLKRLLCSCGDGLVTEEVVEAETATAQGVVDLMALPTEKLIEEFRRLSGGTGRMPPMMMTTRRWSRWDAGTVLRVLCHRDDEAASRFLKKTFELPKRR